MCIVTRTYCWSEAQEASASANERDRILIEEEWEEAVLSTTRPNILPPIASQNLGVVSPWLRPLTFTSAQPYNIRPR